MIRFLTAGESHGDALIGIIEGLPSNLFFDIDFINQELGRRQMGYGRSNRMAIERDEIKLLSGVNKNLTTGNPIGIMIKNRGKNVDLIEVTRPRPGHGDLAGTLKYNFQGGRNVLERASARETAMRVALGAICKLLLKEFHIKIYSHIVQIGEIKISDEVYLNIKEEDLLRADESPVRMLDKDREGEILSAIDKAKEKGDTLGGILEVIGKNIPIGLGSYANWDRKIDGKIAYGIMSIPGIKGIEFGLGFKTASRPGSQVHDEIYHDGKRFFRKTNNAGGMEAGVTNGEDIVFRAVMKPIPTLRKALRTVDIRTKEGVVAQFERSDVCAVPAASIVAENILAYILANEMVLKFGGDSLEEMKENFKNYKEILENR